MSTKFVGKMGLGQARQLAASGRHPRGLHDIAIEVRALDGSGIVNLERLVIQLT
jgi:hypothetical protein